MRALDAAANLAQLDSPDAAPLDGSVIIVGSVRDLLGDLIEAFTSSN